MGNKRDRHKKSTTHNTVQVYLEDKLDSVTGYSRQPVTPRDSANSGVLPLPTTPCNRLTLSDQVTPPAASTCLYISINISALNQQLDSNNMYLNQCTFYFLKKK